MRYVVSAMLIVVGVIHLAWSVGSYNTQVGHVFAVDVVARVCLVNGGAAHVYALRQA